MARYVVVHPHDPQPRLVEQVVALLRNGALIAYPTDSCYALGARMDSHDGAVRIVHHPFAAALVRELGEPLLSSTLLLPGQPEPMTEGWQIKEELGHPLDAVVDAGDCGTEPTTVVDWSEGYPQVVRVGAGDPSRFE